jgi:hypothetical protein
MSAKEASGIVRLWPGYSAPPMRSSSSLILAA